MAWACSASATESKRQGKQDYARFLNIAEGSLAEVHYLLLLSRDLDYMDTKVANRLRDEAEEISRMLYAFRRKVETSK